MDRCAAWRAHEGKGPASEGPHVLTCRSGRTSASGSRRERRARRARGCNREGAGPPVAGSPGYRPACSRQLQTPAASRESSKQGQNKGSGSKGLTKRRPLPPAVSTRRCRRSPFSAGCAWAARRAAASTSSKVRVASPSIARRNSPSTPFASPGDPNIVWAMCTPSGTAPTSRTARGTSPRTRPCQHKTLSAPSLGNSCTDTEALSSRPRRSSSSCTSTRSAAPAAAAASTAFRNCASTAELEVTTWLLTAMSRSPFCANPSHGPCEATLPTCSTQPPAADSFANQAADGRSFAGIRRSLESSVALNVSSREGTSRGRLRTPRLLKWSITGRMAS
mmetsp:Transcript_124145/g.356608  ORF Transcript_124145/g.356608 Transcript_124145/m.356608 type:complete len:335 (-) Transcript_124145:2256-3260(-)